MKPTNIKKVLLVPVFIGILALTGCGTIFGRLDGSNRDNGSLYYPATTYDTLIVSSGGGVWAYGEGRNISGWQEAFGWGLIVPFHVIDYPISIVTDTLLLPVDAMRTSKANRLAFSDNEKQVITDFVQKQTGEEVISICRLDDGDVQVKTGYSHYWLLKRASDGWKLTKQMVRNYD